MREMRGIPRIRTREVSAPCVALAGFAWLLCSCGPAVATSRIAAPASTDVALLPVPAEIPRAAILREQHVVDGFGGKELFRLFWLEPPADICVTHDELASCPCAGFGYGKTGKLILVRSRVALPDEFLDLGTLFESDRSDKGKGLAKVAEYPMREGEGESPVAPKIYEKRPKVSLLKFADYTHDGKATEFVFYVGSSACGHGTHVLVGVFGANEALAEYRTAGGDGGKLSFGAASDWDALRDHARVARVTWKCMDHGSFTETSFEATASEGVIAGVVRTRDCDTGIELSSSPL